MEVSKKVAYLRGLIDGLQLDENKPETKIFRAISDVLESCADEIDALNAEAERVDDYLDELDHDLGDIESVVFDMDDDDDEDEDYDYDFEDEDDSEDDGLCGDCDDCNMCGGTGEDE